MERGKKQQFKKILKGIKEIKIQGAKNIAKKALYAYTLIPTKRSKKKLLALRPTEPLLINVLKKTETTSPAKILEHFKITQEKINKNTFNKVKNKDTIFTHCHSSTVVEALINAKKKKKKFEVYNTETRPLFQGRKTTLELKKSKIKTTQFVDSAAMIALTKKQGTKKVNKVFIGADAILRKGVINKVGSGMFSKIAFDNKIPVYVLANSWKFSPKQLKMEKRSFKEIWKGKSKGRIHIENPAFEFVPRKYITAIISELGVLNYKDFLKKFSKR